MATLRQIGYDIYQHIRANFTDDDDIDIRNIYFWIRNQRLLWLENKSNKPINRKFYQPLGNHRIKPQSTLDGTPLVVPIHFTEKTIPIPAFKGKMPYMNVSPIDPRVSKYKVVLKDDAFAVGNGRFNKNEKFAFLNEDYRIGITGLENNAYVPLLKLIHIEIIAEDPLTVPGTTLDSTYPIDDALIPYMLEIITKSHIKQFIEGRVDSINNAKNDLN